jgi:hypothetical protein
MKKWLSECKERFSKSFANNTGAWLLFGALLLVAHGNYTIGSDLHKVCELITEDDLQLCIDGDCNVLANDTLKMKYPKTIKQEISDVCEAREPDDTRDDDR